jgi:hypothetical protein
MRKIILSLLALVTLISCTENVRAKSWGGTMSINVPKGNKVTNITWKEGDLWYSYRPLQDGEEPTIQTFVEESNLGIMEGKVIFIESK